MRSNSLEVKLIILKIQFIFNLNSYLLKNLGTQKKKYINILMQGYH